MSGGQSSFSLSEAYRALGVRDARAVPTVFPGVLTPVIQMGSIQTFSPEVIEARAFLGSLIAVNNVNSWSGIQIQSLAKGGIVIEELFVAGFAPISINRAPNRPWTGGAFPVVDVLQTGGGSVNSLVGAIQNVAGSPPGGLGALGGSQGNISDTAPASQAVSPIWVPAGEWFWVTIKTDGSTAPPISTAFRIKWRELPEMQGAP